MEKTEKLLRSILGITDSGILEMALQVSRIIDVPRKAHIFRQGEPFAEIAFLISGMFRFYSISSDGKEHTECFCGEFGFPVMPASDLKMVLPINIQALEDSTVLVIPTKIVEELMHENIEIMRIYNKFLQESVALHWETKIALYQYDAEKRYEWFLKRYEGLIDRVPHIYIASFLNITPVTLSGQRERLSEEAE